ncbi:hypothetical protein DA792_09315 [Celeribacter baekdonensis]|uniref:Uncharacterized protein n=1 Tax=Celeribacter baekdonensis TaxID=875171 RepID=A0A2R4M264_9RHOB|nr:hypothetical protein DA792_09315 [Celeribacter baekdonensis]
MRQGINTAKDKVKDKASRAFFFFLTAFGVKLIKPRGVRCRCLDFNVNPLLQGRALKGRLLGNMQLVLLEICGRPPQI